LFVAVSVALIIVGNAAVNVVPASWSNSWLIIPVVVVLFVVARYLEDLAGRVARFKGKDIFAKRRVLRELRAKLEELQRNSVDAQLQALSNEIGQPTHVDLSLTIESPREALSSGLVRQDLRTTPVEVDSRVWLENVARDGGLPAGVLLGPPGSGKTTLMLELTRMMVHAAETDRGRSEVLPVFIDLASWRPEDGFKAWLIRRMSDEYGTGESILEKWLQEGSIALILDNVSWLPREAIESSLEEIMEFRRQFPGVDVLFTANEDVIGSYLARLQLRIIRINELDQEDVRSFLARFQTSHSSLVDAVDTDDRLASLLTSRLLMTSALLAFRERAIPTAGPVDRNTLMQALVEYLMSRTDRKGPAALDLDLTKEKDRKVAMKFLAWLAAKLAPGESVFFNQFTILDLPRTPFGKIVQAVSSATFAALTGLWFFAMFALLTSVGIAAAVGGLIFIVMALFGWLGARAPREFGSESPFLGLSMGATFSWRRLLDEVRKHRV
jgi:hypothetical protein